MTETINPDLGPIDNMNARRLELARASLAFSLLTKHPIAGDPVEAVRSACRHVDAFESEIRCERLGTNTGQSVADVLEAVAWGPAARAGSLIEEVIKIGLEEFRGRYGAPAEPEAAPVEPEAAPVEPEAAPVEPEAAPVEPEAAAPVKPEAAPVEPEAAGRLRFWVISEARPAGLVDGHDASRGAALLDAIRGLSVARSAEVSGRLARYVPSLQRWGYSLDDVGERLAEAVASTGAFDAETAAELVRAAWAQSGVPAVVDAAPVVEGAAKAPDAEV